MVDVMSSTKHVDGYDDKFVNLLAKCVKPGSKGANIVQFANQINHDDGNGFNTLIIQAVFPPALSDINYSNDNSTGKLFKEVFSNSLSEFSDNIVMDTELVNENMLQSSHWLSWNDLFPLSVMPLNWP